MVLKKPGKGPAGGEITRLLVRMRVGDDSARQELISLVYAEVRRIARGHLRRERKDHSLQATDLVHEAYLRLMGEQTPDLNDRRHFYAVFCRSVRRVLVDHARERAARKRGGDWQRVTLSAIEEIAAPPGAKEMDILLLHELLERLAELSARQSRIVELRFFAGASIPETAELLGVSVATVNREWSLARAWLQVQLSTH